jgi:hypothetical protein
MCDQGCGGIQRSGKIVMRAGRDEECSGMIREEAAEARECRESAGTI